VLVTAWILARYDDVVAALNEFTFRAKGWTDSRQAHIISHRQVKPVRL
jgi:hypothetical protein